MRALLYVLCALIALPGSILPAAAATCAEHVVEARGEPSRFELLAKTKARGNWRAKVRAMSDLGAAYANWSKAVDGDYRCSQEAGLYVCVATAHPCRD
jgi:hypothetical protein